jgi:hypothetical protein
MRLELERGLELFFQKKLKQTITHPLSMFSVLFLCFCCSKNICNSSICVSNDMKITQFRIEENIEKCSIINNRSVVDGFYTKLLHTTKHQTEEICNG